MSDERNVNGVKRFEGAAGGWQSLTAVANAIRHQLAIPNDLRALGK